MYAKFYSNIIYGPLGVGRTELSSFLFPSPRAKKVPGYFAKYDYVRLKGSRGNPFWIASVELPLAWCNRHDTQPDFRVFLTDIEHVLPFEDRVKRSTRNYRRLRQVLSDAVLLQEGLDGIVQELYLAGFTHRVTCNLPIDDISIFTPEAPWTSMVGVGADELADPDEPWSEFFFVSTRDAVQFRLRFADYLG